MVYPVVPTHAKVFGDWDPVVSKCSYRFGKAWVFHHLNIFCEKTTVLAEKVFHPAAGEAQLKAFVTC